MNFNRLNKEKSDFHEIPENGGKITTLTQQHKPESQEKEIISDFERRLNTLKNFLKTKNEFGLEVTKEEIEKVSGLDFNILAQFLKIHLNRGEKNLGNIFYQNILQIEENKEENWFKRFVNNPKTRTIFAALMISLKLSPGAHASPTYNEGEKYKDNNYGDIGLFVPQTYVDPKIYKITESNFGDGDKNKDSKKSVYKFENNEESLKINFINYFETNSDKITEQGKNKIIEIFNDFLNQINKDNIDKFINSNLVVNASCDERETNFKLDENDLEDERVKEYKAKLTESSKGGNDHLSVGRGLSLLSILEKAKNDYKYNRDIPKDKVDEFIKKEINIKIPEGGITHITDLKNPETNNNFTEAEIVEIKKYDDEFYKDLLRQCRKVTFEIEIQNMFSLFEGYDNIFMVFDNSGSVGFGQNGDLTTNKYMAKIFNSQKEKIKNVKMFIGTFDGRGLGDLKNINDLGEVSSFLDRLPCNGEGYLEKSLGSLIQVLKNPDFKKEGRSSYIIFTDEPIQDTYNFTELNDLIKKLNINGEDIKFCYANDQEGKLYYITLDKIKSILGYDLEKIKSLLTEGNIEKINKIILSLIGKEQKDIEFYEKDILNKAGYLKRKTIEKNDLEDKINKGHILLKSKKIINEHESILRIIKNNENKIDEVKNKILKKEENILNFKKGLERLKNDIENFKNGINNDIEYNEYFKILLLDPNINTNIERVIKGEQFNQSLDLKNL